MDYLALCKRVHLLARFGEDRPGTAPSTVLAQTGPLAEIVSWVNMTYEDIQRERAHWNFRSKIGTLTMVVNQSVYTPASAGITDFEELLASEAGEENPFVGVYFGTRSDESKCWYIPYEEWKGGIYDRGIITSGAGRPAYFTQAPDGTLIFYPKPERIYSVMVPYVRTIHSLAADADLPIIPTKFHILIVWRVIRDYYCTTREGTRELRENSDKQIKPLWYAITRDQLPEFLTS